MDVPQPLTFQTSLDGSRPWVKLAGVLDLSTATTASELLAELLASHPDELVLDLRDVTFLDSRGVAVIVETADALRRGKLTIRNAKPRMIWQIERAGTNGYVTFDERPDDGTPGTG